MRLSLEIGCAGVKGMQTNVYLSEDLMRLLWTGVVDGGLHAEKPLSGAS